jgi:hypothetical protein
MRSVFLCAAAAAVMNVCLSHSVSAENVEDLDKTVKALLAKVQVPYTHKVVREDHSEFFCRKGKKFCEDHLEDFKDLGFASCDDVPAIKECFKDVTDMIKVTAKNITIKETRPAVYDNDNMHTIMDTSNPSAVYYVLTNCGDVDADMTPTKTIQYAHSVTGTTTKQFQLSEGAVLSMSGSIPIATVTGSLNITAQETWIQADADQTTETNIETAQSKTTVKAGKQVYARQRMGRVRYETPFAVRAIIDAELVPDDIPGKKHLSDLKDVIPPNELLRDINGTLRFGAQWTQTTFSAADTADTADCSSVSAQGRKLVRDIQAADVRRGVFDNR